MYEALFHDNQNLSPSSAFFMKIQKDVFRFYAWLTMGKMQTKLFKNFFVLKYFIIGTSCEKNYIELTKVLQK